MMRIRRLVLVACLAGAVSAGVFSSGPAAASTPTLVVDPIRGPGGTAVALTGAGFCASCGTVEIDFGPTPVKRGVVVGANGSFQTNFTVPGGAQAGTNAINAYQQGVLVSQTTFEVTPSTPAPTQHPVSPTPQASPTTAQSPRASPTPAPSPTPSPSPVAPSGGGSASPTAAPGGNDFPMGLFLAILVVLAVAGGAILAAWWRRRQA